MDNSIVSAMEVLANGHFTRCANRFAILREQLSVFVPSESRGGKLARCYNCCMFKYRNRGFRPLGQVTLFLDPNIDM